MSDNKRPVYTGFCWDEWTPAVQAQMVRDIMALQEATNKWKDREVVAVSRFPDADPILVQLGVKRVAHEALAKFWRCYEVHQEPDVPEHAEDISHVVLTPNTEPSPLSKSHFRGFDLQEQGQDTGDTSLINRPAPDAYVPVNPALVSIWGT